MANKKLTYKLDRTEHQTPLGQPIYHLTEWRGREIQSGWYGTYAEMVKIWDEAEALRRRAGFELIAGKAAA